MITYTDTLSRIYASSLFELSEEAGGQDAILEAADELEQVIELARANATFREFLGSPLIGMQARSDSLTSIFSGQMTDLVLRFLLVVNANDRLEHLEMISEALTQLVHEHWGRVEVDVTTAHPLGEASREAIVACIKKAIGKEPVLHSTIDPDIIGGLRIRIGDQLIDGSVATQLRHLEDDLKKVGAHQIRMTPERFLEDSK